MGVDEAMIVAGLGSRKGVTAEQVLAAIRAAAGSHGLALSRIGGLATGETKSDEGAFAEAALELGLPVEYVATERLQAQPVLSHSVTSLKRSGTGSLSEAA